MDRSASQSLGVFVAEAIAGHCYRIRRHATTSSDNAPKTSELEGVRKWPGGVSDRDRCAVREGLSVEEISWLIKGMDDDRRAV
jgi:hypothetical protein